MVNHLTNYPHKKLASKSTVNNILPKKKSLHHHNPGNKERHTVSVEPHRPYNDHGIHHSQMSKH